MAKLENGIVPETYEDQLHYLHLILARDRWDSKNRQYSDQQKIDQIVKIIPKMPYIRLTWDIHTGVVENCSAPNSERESGHNRALQILDKDMLVFVRALALCSNLDAPTDQQNGMQALLDVVSKLGMKLKGLDSKYGETEATFEKPSRSGPQNIALTTLLVGNSSSSEEYSAFDISLMVGEKFPHGDQQNCIVS